MSIYATMWTIQIEDEDRGGVFSEAWHEVWAQGVPNHINEQNGFCGPIWDEWLPAFVHQPGCTMRHAQYQSINGPQDYCDCDCGLRAVFICDDLTKKGTERNGQEYVNPVLVLTGAEYEALSFGALLQRIEESVSERRGRVLCLEPDCIGEATTTTIHRGQVIEAWCSEHETPERMAGQRQRREQAPQEAPR